MRTGQSNCSRPNKTLPQFHHHRRTIHTQDIKRQEDTAYSFLSSIGFNRHSPEADDEDEESQYYDGDGKIRSEPSIILVAPAARSEGEHTPAPNPAFQGAPASAFSITSPTPPLLLQQAPAGGGDTGGGSVGGALVAVKDHHLTDQQQQDHEIYGPILPHINIIVSLFLDPI